MDSSSAAAAKPRRLVFPGVGEFIDAALRDNPRADQLRGEVSDCDLLSRIGDLVGQAYSTHRGGNPAAAVATLAAAAQHLEALALRHDVASDVLGAAVVDLAPAPEPAAAPRPTMPEIGSSPDTPDS